ncbi:XRE family transcriptional regulator [Pseudonocardia hispaniensis]|uniref:XRE family transcriptional regulator n=1 Tax=Pseudonocardia hispaniensis TaxID=904933 RepID=A0ABW1J230_9PSEU
MAGWRWSRTARAMRSSVSTRSSCTPALPPSGPTSIRRGRPDAYTEIAAGMETSQSAVARLERGDVDARLSTLERLAAACGRPVDVVAADRDTGQACDYGLIDVIVGERVRRGPASS